MFKPKLKLSPEQEEQVLALYEHDAKIAEIALQFGVSGGTIKRILHRHAAMRPRYASTREQETIRKLSGKRKAKQIAKCIGRSLSFVKFWQRRQGFHAHPKPTVTQLVKVIELTFGGNDSVKTIARKLGLPYWPTLRLIHKIRQCEKFLPTATLSSHFPMKHRDSVVPRATEEEVMLRLLHHARAVCLEAHVSADPARLVSISIAVAAKLYLRESGGARTGYTDAEYARMLSALGPRFHGALVVH
jgi:transposase-like protein